MRIIVLFFITVAAFSVMASETCFEVSHVCKAISRASQDYRGTSRLEPSRLLAESGARRACQMLLSTSLPTLPSNYCTGDVDIQLQCEEISFENCTSIGFVCKAIHWNGGDHLGVGQIEASRFLAEDSAIKDCRRSHRKDLGYPADYCEVHSIFKCEEILKNK